MTRVVLASALLLCLLPVSSAPAAGNSVSSPRLGRAQSAIGPNTLKPSSCSALTLTTLVTGVTGTANNDLQLGGSAGQSMSAAGGNDCIHGGGGNDSINCGSGTDVAIGGPGTDTFSLNCETQIQ
jgi:Ca2+-binding RTX toxin-like protein